MSLIPRFKYICLYGQMHSARWILATAETLWALLLVSSWATFPDITHAKMSMGFSADLWATVFALAAVGQWGILISGKYHTRWAVAFAFWNQLWWWYVVISLYLSGGVHIEGLALALGASWVYIRSGFCVKGRRADDGC